MKEEISIIELYNILRKRVGVIVNAILVGVLLSAIYTFFIATPQYNSTTDILVNRGESQETSSIDRTDIDTNIQLINTYSDIITRPVILDEVIDTLEMDTTSSELAESITVTNENNSQMFSITVTNENPYDAARIVDVTASVFQEKMQSPDLLNVDNVAILTNAEVNVDPVSPNNTINIIIGAMLGAFVGIGTSLLLVFLDNTVKDEKFIIENTGWTSLGRISEMSSEELASNGRSALKENKDGAPSRSARTRV